MKVDNNITIIITLITGSKFIKDDRYEIVALVLKNLKLTLTEYSIN